MLKHFNLIAKKHGTDKYEHGYMPYYQKHLQEDVRTMLEVGVAKGASANMWLEIFGYHELDLHIADLFENRDFVSLKWCRDKGIVPHKGDQSDVHFLYTIKEKFDLIVEDGSHNSHDQLVSFIHLFQNNLKSGGWYVAEDLHCCKESFYRQKNNVNESDTILQVFKTYIDTGLIMGSYFPPHIASSFMDMIDVAYLYDDKILFIKKK